MSKASDAYLNHFLSSFGATSLGEGDPVAGANLLATMACTLANIARPGSGVVTEEGRRMRVGTSLLVSGPLSSSLVADDLITELRIRQNNLTDHLRRLFADKLEDAGKKGMKTREFPAGPRTNESENALLDLQQVEPLLWSTIEEAWAEVVIDPPNPRIEDLAAQPKIIVTASGPAELERQLVGLHLGHPLVLLGLRHAKGGRLGELCTALMDGHLPSGLSGGTTKGNLLITDPARVLHEVAKTNDNRTAWLGRLVWLPDGTAGPEPPESSGSKPPVHLDEIAPRFGTALSRAFAKRLNNHSPQPVVHESNLTKAQVRWVTFLKGMEDRLPGISGTARRLLATLAFGLSEIVNAIKAPAGFDYYIAGTEAFARFLVHRMANARAAILWSAEDAQKQQLKTKILYKINGDPLLPRDIYHNIRGLPANQCRELLLELEAEELATRIGDRWQHLNAAGSNRQPLVN